MLKMRSMMIEKNVILRSSDLSKESEEKNDGLDWNECS
jgi:hypothetical protein